MGIIPKKKPQRGLDWLQSIIDANKKAIGNNKVILIGLRGYYRDSMGAVGKNDRKIYDDAFFWVNLETGFIDTYNGNVDPNGWRKGWGTGKYKGMANLKEGVWMYQKGRHNGSKPHMAFRQAADVTVIRDGDPPYEDTGMFGINIHCGSTNSTSSLGCQTVPPSQWEDFRKTGYTLLENANEKVFPYILVMQQG